MTTPTPQPTPFRAQRLNCLPPSRHRWRVHRPDRPQMAMLHRRRPSSLTALPASMPTTVRIFTPNGILHKIQTIVVASETKIKLEHGVYIVTLNNSLGTKVIINEPQQMTNTCLNEKILSPISSIIHAKNTLFAFFCLFNVFFLYILYFCIKKVWKMFGVLKKVVFLQIEVCFWGITSERDLE